MKNSEMVFNSCLNYYIDFLDAIELNTFIVDRSMREYFLFHENSILSF